MPKTIKTRQKIEDLRLAECSANIGRYRASRVRAGRDSINSSAVRGDVKSALHIDPLRGCRPVADGESDHVYYVVHADEVKVLGQTCAVVGGDLTRDRQMSGATNEVGAPETGLRF
jgi:hypothetical protein